MRRLIFLLLAVLFAAPGYAQYPGAAFPSRTATSTDLQIATNRAETTLTGSVNASTLAFPVASISLFTPPTTISIDNEVIKICSKSGTTLTACASGRGADNTTAATHSSGVAVQHRIAALMHNQLAAEIIAIENKLNAEFRSVVDFGADPTFVADSTAAFVSCIATKNCFVPDGHYKTTAQLNITVAKTTLTCQSNAGVIDLVAGSAIEDVLRVSGGIRDTRIVNCTLGGNANVQHVLHMKGTASSHVTDVILKNSTQAGLMVEGSNTNHYDNLTISNNVQPFTTVPTYGMWVTAGTSGFGESNSTYTNLAVEGLLTGVQCDWCYGSIFTGGTIEGNTVNNLIIGGSSTRNIFTAVDLEVTAGSDMICGGSWNQFFNMTSAGVFAFNGGYTNMVIGGRFQSISVTTSVGTIFQGIEWNQNGGGTFVDNGTDTQILRIQEQIGGNYSTMNGNYRLGALVIPGLGAIDQQHEINGTWGWSGAPVDISPYVFTPTTPWRALFFGNWEDTISGAPVQLAPIIEFTNAQPAITVGVTAVVTITRNAGTGHLQISTSSGTVGFVGRIMVIPIGNTAVQGDESLRMKDRVRGGALSTGVYTYALLLNYIAEGKAKDGDILFCDDCTAANPTAAGAAHTGTIIYRRNGVWLGLSHP